MLPLKLRTLIHYPGRISLLRLPSFPRGIGHKHQVKEKLEITQEIIYNAGYEFIGVGVFDFNIKNNNNKNKI